MMKRVVIIGSGPAGIVALKTTKEYGYDVTCFEMESSFGGTWDNSERKMGMGYETLENKVHGITSGYSSLMMNTSSAASEFSDFPVDESMTFLPQSEYLAYLRKYLEHFDLTKDIKYNTTVNSLEKNGTDWQVNYTVVENGTKQHLAGTFNFVIIATGPLRYPTFPKITGLELFSGLVIHTGQVRNEAILFKNKVILVLGIGNSSFELTCGALMNGAKKVYMSVTETERRNQFMGNHFLPDPRQNGHPLPYDAYALNWYARDRGEDALQEFLRLWTKPVKASTSPDHVFQVPKDGLVASKADVIDDMTTKGKFEKVCNVYKITENQIELEDKKVLCNVDIILCGTGFTTRYPMLNDIWSVEEQQKVELHHHMVSPDQNLDGLIFVNTANSISASVMPVAEMQARFACEKLLTRNYNTDGTLFTREERDHMKKEIREEELANQKYDRAFNFLVDIPGYNRKLALEIGCVPPDPKLLLQPGNNKEDIEFGVALYYGPIIGAQYRLNGSRAWEGARQHILDVSKEALGSHFNELVEKHLS